MQCRGGHPVPQVATQTPDKPNRCTGGPPTPNTVEEGQRKGFLSVQTTHAAVHSISSWGGMCVCVSIFINMYSFYIILHMYVYKSMLYYSVSCGIE